MSKSYVVDDKGCRLLSSKQWKQLRERVRRHPLLKPFELEAMFSEKPVPYNTGKITFVPTEEEWAEAKWQEQQVNGEAEV